MKTLGKKMVKMQPIHGFAAQTTAATVIFIASRLGMPISTTHVITTSIMGVGATKRLNAVKWSVVGRVERGKARGRKRSASLSNRWPIGRRADVWQP